MNLESKKLFTSRSLIAMLIPLALEVLLNIMVGLVDGIMVSPVGEAAISGVNLVDNISNFLSGMYAGLATGGGVVVSQFIGAQRMDQGKRTCGQLVLISVGFSIVLCIPCMIFPGQILGFVFGQVEQDVMENALAYFFYCGLSYPFIALFHAGACILRANGDTRTSFYVSLLKNVINIVGNALCVYGLKMGVAGVAIPTLVGRAVSAIVIMWVIMNRKDMVRPTMKDIFCMRKDLQKQILQVGLPTSLQNSTLRLGRVLTLSMISVFGTQQMAANSTAGLLTNFVTVIPSAMNLAFMTVVGQCVGSRDEGQVRENVRKLMTWCYVSNGLLCVLMALLRYQLLGLYDSLSPETVELASKLILIHVLPTIVLYPAAFVMDGALRASRNSAFATNVNITGMILWRLGLGYVLCVMLGWGVVGVWTAMVCSWGWQAAFYTWRYLSGGWKKNCNLA